MTDTEIIQGLIAKDEKITQSFFFHRCQPLIFSLIGKFYPGGADYEELVNELYVHLMEDGARRLKMFEGRSSIYQWLKMVATNFFLDRKKREHVIENAPSERLSIKPEDTPLTDNAHKEAEMDVAAILDQIENENYRLVLQRHVLEGMSFEELEKITGLSRDYLYNIKSRALKAVRKIARIAQEKGDALCDVRCEEYILHCFGIHKSLEELKELALSKGWLSEEGVLVESLGKLSSEFGLSITRHKDADLQIIIKALEEGKQVLAAVDGGELIGDPVEERLEDVFAGGIADHCIVVLSLDIQADEVVLYDPAFGVIPLTVTMAHFLDAWHDSNYYCVLIGQ